jgi:hypothetical protein
VITINFQESIMGKCKKMTEKSASRIQSATAKKSGGKVEKGSFAARAQTAGAKNQNTKQSSGSKSGTAKKSTGK